MGCGLWDGAELVGMAVCVGETVVCWYDVRTSINTRSGGYGRRSSGGMHALFRSW